MMKRMIGCLLILCAHVCFADQLAYISKAQADEAVAFISTLNKVYLFCGCCEIRKPEKVKPVKVYAKHTGHASYYEVHLEYTDETGKIKTTPLDLAYVWYRKLRKYNTIGDALKLEHDRCVYLRDWKKQYIEK